MKTKSSQQHAARQHMALLWAAATFAVTAILPMSAMISQFEEFGGAPTVIAYALAAGLCTGTVYWWNAQPRAAKAAAAAVKPAEASQPRAAEPQPIAPRPVAPQPVAKLAPANPVTPKPSAPKPVATKPVAPKPAVSKSPSPKPAMLVHRRSNEQPTVNTDRIARALNQNAQRSSAGV